MENLAPVVLFVYNRPNLTYQTLNNLKKNKLAEQTDLYIFSDGSKDVNQVEKVSEVRRLIKGIDGFKKVEIVASELNKGLSTSIITGVTQIIKEYGRVIVLEDDLLTSRNFLTYMNEALKYYESNNQIWSISGYSPNINFPANYKRDLYLVPRACSWGWATWENRWSLNDWSIRDYEDFKNNNEDRERFNLAGNDMAPMLDDQLKGIINSWAIRWCYNQFRHQSLTVYPRYSLVTNAGLTGDSATHGSFNKRFNVPLNEEHVFEFSNDLEMDINVVRAFAKNYNLTAVNYIGRALKRIGLYHKAKRMYKKIAKG